MAIYTPLQVPQPITDSHVVQPAPTPRRVHTRSTHRLGLAFDVTLAVIAIGVILLVVF
jgi:D-alanyl-D-alanine dipeptidase